MSDTELRLIAWRDGATQAERLSAAILRLAGYEAVDPQAPLGGPDGGRDIVCSKGGVTWTCAVHFPPTAVGFAAVRRKFLSDLSKVVKDHRGFAFVTNRPLTVAQVTSLREAGREVGKEVDIFALERIRTLLDQPRGYGIRLQFLRIAMTTEDQLSWFAESDDRVLNALNINTREIISLREIMRGVARGNDEIMRTMSAVGGILPPTPDLLTSTNFVSRTSMSQVSAAIDVGFILFIHRLTCFDIPTRMIGVLRTEEVWLVNRSGERAQHLQPVRVDQVQRLMEELCASWREQFESLKTSAFYGRIEEIGRFHASFLAIHPFSDGNGRVARAILMQQCLDLFGVANMSLLEQGSAYYRALAAADQGNLEPLVSILQPVVNR